MRQITAQQIHKKLRKHRKTGNYTHFRVGIFNGMETIDRWDIHDINPINSGKIIRKERIVGRSARKYVLY